MQAGTPIGTPAIAIDGFRFFFGLGFGLAAIAGCPAAGAAAGGAGAGNAEESLLIAYLTAARARLARRGAFPGGGAAAFALLTGFITTNFDLGLFAESRFFKSQQQVSSCIAAAL